MQMTDREYVEGTDPAIYIGHRILRHRDGGLGQTKSFHAEYTLESRQHSKSLGTSNKAVAIRNAHALCQRLIEGTEIKPLRKVSVTEMKDAYLEVLTNRGRTEKTMVKYRYVLKEFAEWWQRRGDRKACAFTERDFWAYRRWLLEDEKKSLQTTSDRLILVKQLFKWGAGKGKMIPINPVADATVPDPPPTPQPCFTPEQVQILLANATPQQRPIFAAMAYLGLRVGEIIALRWEDVLFDRGETGFVHVRLGGSNGTTKGKKSRLVPIHPELRPILEALPRISDRVFTRPPSSTTPQTGLPLHDRHLLVSIKKLCEKCGFADANKYKLHTFRHAFASMCARSQVSAKYALNWMGHKSSEILDMYITMYDSTAESAMRTISYGGPAQPATATAAIATVPR
jgi:integrase